MNNDRGFFSLLFDLSFDEFVTVKIIRVLYVLAIVVAGLGALAGIFGSAVGPFGSPGGGLIGVLMSLVFFFLYVIIARVTLEAIVALFRIAENTSVMAHNARPGGLRDDEGAGS